jgi:hypothetical protein
MKWVMPGTGTVTIPDVRARCELMEIALGREHRNMADMDSDQLSKYRDELVKSINAR